MKKILKMVGLLAFSSFFALSIVLANDETAKPLTKVQLKEQFKANVKKLENGDVVIYKIPEQKGNSEFINGYLKLLLCYSDANVDFEAFDRHMQNSLKKQANSYAIKDITNGVSKYLGTKNMNLQNLNFSKNNIISRIDDGFILFAYLLPANGNAYETSLKTRTTKRKTFTDMKAWEKELRKAEIKNIAQKSTTLTDALIIGYNEETDEFLVLVKNNIVWLTDGELKSLCKYLYALRV